MLRRIILATVLIELLILLAALITYGVMKGATIQEFGNALFWCSIGAGLLAGAFVCGPGPSGDTEYSVTAMHCQDSFVAPDREDRERGMTYGLLIFFAAIISGSAGFFLSIL